MRRFSLVKLSLVLLASAALVHCGDGRSGKTDIRGGAPRPVVKKTDDPKMVDEAKRLDKMKEASTDTPEQPLKSYIMFAKCAGWPMKNGEGTIEFYWNADEPKDRVIMVRTSGSPRHAVEQTFAVITPITTETDQNSFLVEQKKSFVTELKTGTELSTIFIFDSGESAELICSTVE